MANTKNKTKENRKAAKRAARKDFKAKLAALSRDERKQLRKAREEGKTESAFLRELAAKKAGGGDE